MDHAQHHMHGKEEQQSGDHCASCGPKHRTDWLLWSMLVVIAAAYCTQLFAAEQISAVAFLPIFTESVFTLMNKMWSGIATGIVFVGILSRIPQDLVRSVIGKGGTFSGIMRATIGGVLLDLCSHGILLVGMQLYKKGASLGQVMAFLIASPWNSISLTVILWSLVGLPWTLAILLLSMMIAILSGWLFEQFVARGVLPKNPYQESNGQETPLALRNYWNAIEWTPGAAMRMILRGVRESKMILRWIFFGVVLAALIQTFVPPSLFSSLFGPTVFGLFATLLFATILEVCSEGSMPVAADFLLRAHAPGNMFAFLMTGISTDYTEIMALRETTGSWKISFFLPLVTLPQVILISLLLNRISL